MKHTSLITHFAAALIITVIILLIYISVQQTYRTAANDPQIQIARDLSNALSKRKPVTQFFPGDTINLEQGLAVFTAVFDKTGKPLHSTGLLKGSLPKPPTGIFEFTNMNNEDILTWQPQNNVRLAMVFEKIKAPGEGFVAAGRSLKVTEARESNLIKMLGTGWTACMGALILHFLVLFYYAKRIAK
jgi:hypothetical protein